MTLDISHLPCLGKEVNMKEFIESLERRRDILTKCISHAEKITRNAPEGHLEVSDSGKNCYFYLLQKHGDKHGVYIPKKEYSLAKALASKDYAQHILRQLKRELQILDRYISLLKKGTAEDVFSKMCTARQKLVTPILVSDELCAKMWENEPFTQSDYKPEKKIYPTKKGDMVRSKSEVLFADMYLDMEIPYRYEQVIRMADGSTMAPDFSLWDKKRRRVVYHEHFGKMDDPDYRRKNLKKIDDYRRNGIYTGKNLIMTFEGDGVVLNMREMRAMIEDLFL